MMGAWTASDGLRRIGREEVVATSGALYEILYGSFEAYLEVEFTGDIGEQDYLGLLEREPTLPDLDRLWDQYTETQLIPDHEIVTKTLHGDGRSCRGDSGGPLLLVSGRGEWEVYGVLSGSPGSARAACDFGQVYATFGPVTFPIIEAGVAWTDPCGTADSLGRCDGSIAERCETDVAANVRRPVSKNCATSGQRCRMGDGGAECSDG
jgi:trypsin